jgi:predicted transposase/invertase (TIGR01784 family)
MLEFQYQWCNLEMAQYNPKIDIVFKKIFGSEENKELLISLINSIVSQADQVVEVELLNPYNAANLLNDKVSILDVKAKNQQGKYYNIEIQMTPDNDYDKQALYYWAKLYSSQLKKAERYATLKKTIGIHVLNFSTIANDKYHNIFDLREIESNQKFSDDIEIHTIEISKFMAQVGDDFVEMAGKIKTKLDMWVAFLAKGDQFDSKRVSMDTADVQKAMQVLECMHFSEKELDMYEDHQKYIMVEASIIQTAEDRGREEGRAEGLEKGREEEATRIATSLLASGMTADQIAAITGLTKQEITRLIKI